MKKLFFKTILLFSIFGCGVLPYASGPMTTGIITWCDGEARKFYNEEPSTLYRSIKHSLRDLDHPILENESYSNGNYYILAGQEDKFKISIIKIKSHLTEVRIRINFLGNKPYAELIYKNIDKNLDVVEFDAKGLPTKTND